MDFDSESEEEEFLGFTREEVEAAQFNHLHEGESDISLTDVSSESDDSDSESSSEEEPQTWNTAETPVNVEAFTENTGPVSGVAEDGTALDFFQLLFPDEIFEHIVEETNRNAAQLIENNPDATWYPTSVEEMKAFFALNIHVEHSVRGDDLVNRRQKDGTIIEVPVPPVVKSYNAHMGGVDLSDQLRQYYAIARRAKSWWRYLMWFCVDVCIVNAHILQSLAPNHPNVEQLMFRLELVRGLIGEFSSRKQTVNEGKVQNGHWPVVMSKGRCKRCLKRKEKTFCRMGCELCGKRICLTCFKNHSFDDLA